MRAFGTLLTLCVLVMSAQAQSVETAKSQPVAGSPVPAGLAAAPPLSTTDPVVDLAGIKRLEVERLRAMAEAGAIPRARLDQAQAELADAEDNMILRRTLYGTVRVEDFTKEQTAIMVEAAERLVQRQQERYEHARDLVAQGVMARATLAALLEDLEFRRKTLDLATFRAKLVDELEEYAKAEEEADTDSLVTPRRVMERYNGRGVFTEVDFARINSAFLRQFAKPLPVSAHGETATHRALGFDHRGRIDIALNPDQREGAWLMAFLKRAQIPFYAFRAAIRGKATGAHFHLGPPSLRFRNAD